MPYRLTDKALILDLDGVVTQTARVHARAWQAMFDEYRQSRLRAGKAGFAPFDIKEDYPRYLDGKPRYDGVVSFLVSRGIDLPQGEPADPPGQETICGLGNRKNEIFHQLIDRNGVEVYADARRFLAAAREKGQKTAVVSSSKNCAEIVAAAGLEAFFAARVDGRLAVGRGLAGKPAPDYFLEAARELGTDPEGAAVFEDAAAGIEAGRRGGFGLVVGVARQGNREMLREKGAHLVIESFDELKA